MGVRIRKMELKDIEAVQIVARKSWHDTYEGIIPREIQDNFLNMAYNDEQMERRVNHSIIFVAEEKGDVVGFASFSPVNEKGQAELGAIYILKRHQGKGIGTQLLNKGMEHLRGVKEIGLDVEKENKIGLQFYQAKGFQVHSEFDDNFDGHILKTIRMTYAV